MMLFIHEKYNETLCLPKNLTGGKRIYNYRACVRACVRARGRVCAPACGRVCARVWVCARVCARACVRVCARAFIMLCSLM